MSCVDRETRKQIFDLLNELYTESEAFNIFITTRRKYDFCHFTHDAWDFEVEALWGETKGVIVCNNFDYVIKIPFDMSEPAFGEANSVPDFDYCRLEWRNYLMACKAEIEYHFAFTDYIGKFHGCPIYIQESICCDEDTISSEAYEIHYKQFRADYEMSADETEEDVQDKFADEYYSEGDEIFDIAARDWDDYDEFCDFCDEQFITDLHSGNAGYRGDELVIVDFSGYIIHPEMYEESYYAICKEAI